MDPFGEEALFSVFSETNKRIKVENNIISTQKKNKIKIDYEPIVPNPKTQSKTIIKPENDKKPKFHDASDKSTDKGLKLNESNLEFGQFQEQIIDKLKIDNCIHEICYPPFWDVDNTRKQLSTALPPSEPAKTYPFKLDSFQKRAINCVERQQNVLIAAHTSAGKTTVAEYAIAKSIKDGARVIYTSPIKALSNQKYRDLYEEFQDVGLMTGDVTINPSASCIVMTTEILRNMLYRGSEVVREVAWVVFDEIHYMKDKSRGVIWEECLILLPRLARFVFLSATIPNASEFACWIAKLNRHPCNVVYTEQRPVPLQHFIYPQGGKGLYLVVEQDGTFKSDNYVKAIADINSTLDLTTSSQRPKKRKKPTSTQDSSDIFKIIKLIMSRKYDPVIVFSFSKRDCETNALLMSKLDFSNDSEKKMIHQIFMNAIDSLSNDDKKLPQVNSILPLLKRGIGIHHSGLLPILKEVIEILFQEGLLKCLFATETFAMGLNMPAKTVVFTNLRKFDGVDFRHISSGEYIQMSGRAGRRGIDDRGITILMCGEKIDPSMAQNILKGSADPLFSSFHLGYNMLLNLLRVEEADPEYMIQHSFYQFQATKKAPELKKKIKELQTKQNNICVSDENEITELFRMKTDVSQLRLKMKSIRNKPEYLLDFLNPGRLIKISDEKTDFGWGILVNFTKVDMQKKFGLKQKKYYNNDGSSYKYIADVLLECAALEHEHADPKPPLSGTKGTFQVVPCELSKIDELSVIRIYLPDNLRSQNAREKVRESMRKVFDQFSEDGPPLLDPVENMNIKSSSFKRIMRKIEFKEDEIKSNELNKNPNILNEIDLYKQKIHLQKDIENLEEQIQEIETNIITKTTLKNMKRVLRRLGHISQDNVVTLKGRVACDISTADELLATEMLLMGHFNDLTSHQIVSLSSCFVSIEKTENIVRLREELAVPFRRLQESAKHIAEVMKDSKIEFDEDDFINSFSPNMMEVVFVWCQGAKFSEICKMTNIFEGSIIRSMRRLEELLGEFVYSAKIIGNSELESKFKQGIELIKRDIIFAASLYL